jgi:hypothetical protein
VYLLMNPPVSYEVKPSMTVQTGAFFRENRFAPLIIRSHPGSALYGVQCGDSGNNFSPLPKATA